MPIIKTCEHCGAKFEATTNRKKYCSTKCKDNHTKKTYTYICIQCGKSFQTHTKDQKYCTHKCYSESKQQLDMITCEYCGKIYRPKSKKDNQRFCSRECYEKHRKKESTLTFKCQYCGKDFEVKNSRKYIYNSGKKQLRKFCSKKCADKSRLKPKEIRYCLNCGKLFAVLPQPSRVNQDRFCSKKCIYEYHTGENAFAWKGGVVKVNDYLRSDLIKWKEKSLKRYNYKCAITGAKGNCLKIHHSKPFHIIRDEVFAKLRLDFRESISDYTNEEWQKIVKEIHKIHNEIIGVPLREDLHKLFHSIYGFNSTMEDLKEFKLRYLTGEFNNKNFKI